MPMLACHRCTARSISQIWLLERCCGRGDHAIRGGKLLSVLSHFCLLLSASWMKVRSHQARPRSTSLIVDRGTTCPSIKPTLSMPPILPNQASRLRKSTCLKLRNGFKEFMVKNLYNTTNQGARPTRPSLALKSGSPFAIYRDHIHQGCLHPVQVDLYSASALPGSLFFPQP